MNRQEIFDTALAHLRKQGKPAMNKGGVCMYRGPGGTMCAVGALIPDDLYVFDMENRSASSVVEQWPALAQHLQVETYDDSVFLRNMQHNLHDTYAERVSEHFVFPGVTPHPGEFPQWLEKRAQAFASSNGLIYKEPV